MLLSSLLGGFFKPEPNKPSATALGERRRGHKDVEHELGCVEQARSADTGLLRSSKVFVLAGSSTLPATHFAQQTSHLRSLSAVALSSLDSSAPVEFAFANSYVAYLRSSCFVLAQRNHVRTSHSKPSTSLSKCSRTSFVCFGYKKMGLSPQTVWN